MNYEQMPTAENREKAEQEIHPRVETSKRLLLALEPTRLNFSKMELLGEEHLAEIPPGSKVVIAVDHLNNLSIPTAALMMGKNLPIIISNQSTQFSFRENPQGHLGVALGGKDNFRGIDYDPESEKPKAFNPENFDSMEESLNEGYAMIVAAHNPVNTNTMPEEGGYGAAYLASIADAYILPVSVDIKAKRGIHTSESKTNFLKNIKASLDVVRERPEVTVSIGRPYKIPQEKDIQRFHEIFMKRKGGEKLSSEESQEFHRLRTSLDEASDEIMKTLAAMLPEEKRGEWK
jgi:hypothetical protein